MNSRRKWRALRRSNCLRGCRSNATARSHSAITAVRRDRLQTLRGMGWRCGSGAADSPPVIPAPGSMLEVLPAELYPRPDEVSLTGNCNRTIHMPNKTGQLDVLTTGRSGGLGDTRAEIEITLGGLQHRGRSLQTKEAEPGLCFSGPPAPNWRRDCSVVRPSCSGSRI